MNEPRWPELRMCEAYNLCKYARRVHVCDGFLWMAGDIRSYSIAGLQVFLSSLEHCLNTRYKNGVLLLFTTLSDPWISMRCIK